MKKLLVVVGGLVVVLAGCVEQDQSPTTESSTSATTAASASVTTTVNAPQKEQPEAVEVPDPVTEPVAVDEPMVLECLQGTPGPAHWSDGTVAFSQSCFDQLDGDGYLRSEREANAFECDGIVCSNPYTGASYPDPAALQGAPDTRTPTYETRSTNPGDYPAPTNTDSADGYGPGVELPPLCIRFPDTFRC